MSSLAVAETILEQLGGRRFIAMTGAKYLCGDSTSLQFTLPARFSAQGINKVKITLDPSDTYTVCFYKVRRAELVLVKEVEGVYCDILKDVFTRTTGLDCTL